MSISLSERLRQVVTSVHRQVERPPQSADRDNTDSIHRGYRIANVLGGQWITDADGSVIVVDRFYTVDRRHGRYSIGEIVDTLDRSCEALPLLERAWPGRDARAYTPRLCFFDLETTGLAGGAGTQAFLAGCAIVEDGGLRVRQFLLPGFEHERPLLAMLAAWCGDGTTLVTFNGRTFDLPLIETRYLFHRLPFGLGGLPHLDMLHPARRLWRQRPTVAGPALDEESCRLSVLERHLAGYHRVGDVPGFEIPSRFFRFVRDGNAHPMEAVLEHNRIDLLSLALVTARVIALLSDGPAAARHPREALGLARVYEQSGLSEHAEASYAHAASFSARVGHEPDVRAEALRRLAVCRRRGGRIAEAAAAWQELMTIPGCPSMLRREAREALAIHHEHRSRDLDTARRLVLDAIAEGAAPRFREQAEYRLNRLERKLSTRTVRQEGGLMAALEDLSYSD